jgi:hypothetical protein
VAERGRHNFQFAGMGAHGNVILGGQTLSSELPNDFHVGLSHANLIDGIETFGTGWQAINRGASSDGAGMTGTQNVFWNLIKRDTRPEALIDSKQYRYGYIIGTRGNPAQVNTTPQIAIQAPDDWVEHLNNGANLVPQSLYLDQKARRDADPTY